MGKKAEAVADFVMQDFSDARLPVSGEGLFSLLSELTLRHCLFGAALVVALVFIFRSKPIMAAVRADFLRIHTIILGGIYFILGIGVANFL